MASKGDAPFSKEDSSDTRFAYGFARGLLAVSARRAWNLGRKEGDKVAPLKVYAVTGDPKGKEVDYAGLRKDKPTVYAFVSAKDFGRPMFRFSRNSTRIWATTDCSWPCG